MSTEKKANIPSPEDAHTASHKIHIKTKVADHPVMEPPSVIQAAAGFVTGQKIMGTFGSANATNQWFNITSAGWLKISTVNANAHMAISIIGKEAYEKQTTVNYSVDASNQVTEIYAW
jgi:hypothetical protein